MYYEKNVGKRDHNELHTRVKCGIRNGTSKTDNSGTICAITLVLLGLKC